MYTDACASGARALVVTPSVPLGVGEADIELPVPESARYVVSLRVVRGVHVPGVHDDEAHEARAPELASGGTGEARLLQTTFVWPATGEGCSDLVPAVLDLAFPRAKLTIAARGSSVAVDKITLRRETR
jgi:hypothetical protein